VTTETSLTRAFAVSPLKTHTALPIPKAVSQEVGFCSASAPEALRREGAPLRTLARPRRGPPAPRE